MPTLPPLRTGYRLTPRAHLIIEITAVLALSTFGGALGAGWFGA